MKVKYETCRNKFSFFIWRVLNSELLISYCDDEMTSEKKCRLTKCHLTNCTLTKCCTATENASLNLQLKPFLSWLSKQTCQAAKSCRIIKSNLVLKSFRLIWKKFLFKLAFHFQTIDSLLNGPISFSQQTCSFTFSSDNIW